MNLISKIKTKRSLKIVYQENNQINLSNLLKIIDQNSSFLNSMDNFLNSFHLKHSTYKS